MPYPIFEYENKTLDMKTNQNELIALIANINNKYTTRWVYELLEKQPEWRQAYEALTPLVRALDWSPVAIGLSSRNLKNWGTEYSQKLKEININKDNQELAKAVIIISIGLAVRQLINESTDRVKTIPRQEIFKGGLETALSIAKNDIFKEDKIIQAILNGTAIFSTESKINETVKKAISPSSSYKVMAKNLKVDVKDMKSFALDLDDSIIPASSSLSNSSSAFSQAPLSPTTPTLGQMSEEGFKLIENSIEDLEKERDALLQEIIKLQKNYEENKKKSPELKKFLNDKYLEYAEIVVYLRNQRGIATGLRIEQTFMMTDIMPALDALKKHLESGKSFPYLFSLVQSMLFSDDSKHIISSIKEFENSQETALDLLPKLISQLEEASKKDSRIARLPPEASIEKFRSLLNTLKEKIAPYAQETTEETEEPTKNVRHNL